jgi:hypothetical protein
MDADVKGGGGYDVLGFICLGFGVPPGDLRGLKEGSNDCCWTYGPPPAAAVASVTYTRLALHHELQHRAREAGSALHTTRAPACS